MTRRNTYFFIVFFFLCTIAVNLVCAQDINGPVLQTLARSAESRSTAGSGPKAATALLAPATNLFEGFFRFPAETRQFIPMAASTAAANTAYFRDVFVGGETFTENPNDGDTISATIIGPGETTPEQFFPFVFHASFNGQQNCWVSFGLAPLCNSNAIDVLWFRQIQCAADGVWTMTFLYNGAVFSSGNFTVLPQVKQDAIPNVYSQLDYSDPNLHRYDSICRTIKSDGTLARDSHICSNPLTSTETPWLINGKGCFLSSTAMVFGYFRASITPPDLNNFLKARNQGYVGTGAVNSAVAIQYPRSQNVSVGFNGAGATSALSQAVCSAGPQLMGVKCVNRHGVLKATHWVLAYGQDQNKTTWLIMDPNGGKPINLSDKYTGFCETRTFQGPEFTFTDQRGITVSFHSPGELLISDPSGRRLGFDPLTNQSFAEIPGGFYDDVGLQDDVTELPADDTDTGKSLGLVSTATGDYPLTVTGTGTGTYNMEIQALDANGQPSLSTFQNVPISTNLVQQMVIHYDSTPGAQIQLAGGFDGGGQRPRDVNRFLTYGSPAASQTNVPAGTTAFPLLIFYGPTVIPGTFSAILNKTDVTSLFHPVAGGHEFVSVPVQSGRNVLLLSIDGNLPSRVATDTDRLVFLVP